MCVGGGMRGWGEWVAGDGHGMGGYFEQGRRGNSGKRACTQITLPAAADTFPAPSSPRNAAAERETRARRVYERAFRGLRDGQPDAKEEAVMLLEAWRTFEAACTSRWVWREGVYYNGEQGRCSAWRWGRAARVLRPATRTRLFWPCVPRTLLELHSCSWGCR